MHRLLQNYHLGVSRRPAGQAFRYKSSLRCGLSTAILNAARDRFFILSFISHLMADYYPAPKIISIILTEIVSLLHGTKIVCLQYFNP